MQVYTPSVCVFFCQLNPYSLFAFWDYIGIMVSYNYNRHLLNDRAYNFEYFHSQFDISSDVLDNIHTVVDAYTPI